MSGFHKRQKEVSIYLPVIKLYQLTTSKLKYDQKYRENKIYVSY